MMDEQKILKLFKNFAGEELNIHGLIAVPTGVEPSFKKRENVNMYFKVLNPNDVSYFKPIAEDFIYDEINDFGGYINKKIDPFFNYDLKGLLYLNKEVRKKIQKVFDSLKLIEFELGDGDDNYDEYRIFIQSVGIRTEAWDNDSFYIKNEVRVLKAEKNGERWDPKEAVNIYVEEFLPGMDESYWETEYYYIEIDNILNNYPLLNDPYGHTAGYYETKFVHY